MIIKLNKLLKYKNTKIIERYDSQFPNSTLSGRDALNEFMKYVWLCHKHEYDKTESPTDQALQFQCTIHTEMEEIDNMWHTFLLFTKDYQSFCNQYLNGSFFHHDPLPRKTKKISPKRYELELEKYLSYIYENLGEETVVKWFKFSE